MAEDFSFEITKKIGLLSEKKGWMMEFNMVSWGGRPAKYDIRTWSPDHQKMGKGVTMTEDEVRALKILLTAEEL